MAFSDRTKDFHQIVKEKRNTLPESKKRKLSKQPKGDDTPSVGREYIKEAYNILNHINTLTRTLGNIRKPYLNVDTRVSPLSRHDTRSIDLGGTDQSWTSIRYLTNEERDQIDLQARVVLSRCADRIKEMEALEKRRSELVASKANPLTRLLPTRLWQDASSASSDFTAAHHSSVTWYLSRRLTEASQSQKEMQEERVKRQLERTRTLGSGATRDAMNIGMGETLSQASSVGDNGTGSWLESASSTLASGFAATIGAPSIYDPSRPSSTPPSLPPPSDDEDEDIELSQSQILQFEAENANILRTVQDTLESVQQAESRLMDISALQMELVTHLTKQTELTDQLYEDAIATTSTVEKGNEQLREAKRRARDGRKFILLFLIGASLSLLFLHYY